MSNISYLQKIDTATVQRAQDKAAFALNRGRDMLQIALVATVQHLALHHDSRMATRLYEKVKDVARRKAIFQWLVTFGHLTVSDDGFSGCAGNAEEHAEACRASFEEAKSTMWWNYREAEPFRGWSAQDAIERVLKQAQKSLEKAKEAGADDKVSMEVRQDTISDLLKLCGFGEIIFSGPSE